ncbi:MAG: ribosome recycling factor [Vulcanimicrobiota bacterium]
MDDDFDLEIFEMQMQDALEALGREFGRVRSGRASPGLVDKVPVEAYGSEMPMDQVATISVPEARTIVIQPFDKGNLSNIERAIHKANLGVTPNNDGHVVRLNLPALTEERRKEYVKVVKAKAEEAKISIRQARRDALEELKKADFPEDHQKRVEDEVQKLTDRFSDRIDTATKAKEKELMEV